MTQSIVAVPASLAVEVAARLARRRRARLVVARCGRGWGGVAPETLERALALGLAHTPVAAVLWGMPSLGPDTPEVLVRRAMGPAVPFALVTGPRGPVGAVLREPGAAGGLPLTIRERLARLPESVTSLLRRAAVLADERGWQVVLVGGLVRDLLLERPLGPLPDIDLAVEGDAGILARGLGAALGAAVREHAAFLTATLDLRNGPRIDVATARRERYRRPGALPEVEPASLVDDLWRRDFSINALAVRLGRDTWGQVLDPTGGLADVRARRVRVLHPLSFVEDPTRVFRAVRFVVRLGVRLESSTRRLLVQAGRLGGFPALSGERLRTELRRARVEASPSTVLEALGRLGALRIVWPAYRCSQMSGTLVRAIDVGARGLALADETWEALDTLALTAHLGRAAAASWAARLGLPAEDLARTRAAAIHLGGALRRVEGPEAAWAVLHRVPEAAAAWALVSGRSRRVRGYLTSYLREWRSLRPLLSGHDILALGVPPGPEVARLLVILMGMQIGGTIQTREQALEWVGAAATRAAVAEARPRRPLTP